MCQQEKEERNSEQPFSRWMGWWERVLTDKDLPDGAAEAEAEHLPPGARVARQEAEGGVQLAAAACDVGHAEPLAESGADEVGAEQEVGSGQDGAHHVVGAHHLRPAVGPELGDDVVLGAVGEPVEEQVYAEQQHAPGSLPAVGRRGPALVLLAPRVQREDGDAGGHSRDNQVLLQGVPPPEESDVEEHYGQQLARLGQREGDVVDVRERCHAERRGQRLREGDQEKRREHAVRGDDWRDGLAAGRGPPEVQGAGDRGQDRLDGKEEDGELPHLGRAVAIGVGRRRDALLEPCPANTGVTARVSLRLPSATSSVEAVPTAHNSQGSINSPNADEQLEHPRA